MSISPPSITEVSSRRAYLFGSTPRRLGFSFSIASIAASMRSPMSVCFAALRRSFQRCPSGTQNTPSEAYSSRSSSTDTAVVDRDLGFIPAGQEGLRRRRVTSAQHAGNRWPKTRESRRGCRDHASLWNKTNPAAADATVDHDDHQDLLDDLMAQVASCFARRETRLTCRDMVHGLLIRARGPQLLDACRGGRARLPVPDAAPAVPRPLRRAADAGHRRRLGRRPPFRRPGRSETWY